MAFCDACLLACFLDRPLHFLVRGDVFKPSLLWFFEKTNQIPIYRFRDGFSNMRKNAETFSKVYEKLNGGAAVLIFAEGNTKLQKRLDPLQKGPARIGLGAVEKHGLDLAIVPIGINYTDGSQFRSDVFISIGDPLALDTFDISSNAATKTSIKSLTDILYDRLLPHVIHLNTRAKEDLISPLEELRFPDTRECRWPILDTNRVRFNIQKKLAIDINEMTDLEVERCTTNTKRELGSRVKSPVKILWLLILSPLMILGIALNALPFYLAKAIAKNKVGEIEFYTPVRLTLSIFLFLIYLIFLAAIGSVIYGFHAFVFVLLFPLLGYLAVILREELLVTKPRKITRIKESQL